MIPLVLLAAGLGALLDVKAIPASVPADTVFFAQIEQDAPAELCVLSGLDMAIYSSRTDVVRRVAFHADTTVFDVADITGDGHSEIVAIENGRIMQYNIPPQDHAPEPVELFTLDTLLKGPVQPPLPEPAVLAVSWYGETLLALPVQTGFELRRLDSRLIASYPFQSADNGQQPFMHLFYADASDGEDKGGPPGSLRLHVSSKQNPDADLPPEFHPAEEAQPMRQHRWAPPSQLAQMAEQAPENWPWFSLRTDGADSTRVLYAPVKPHMNSTQIRLREISPTVNPWSESGIKILPARQYPGILAAPRGSIPDFNGDGYADLFLWWTPKPGKSLDSLMSAIIGKTWPIHVSMHLFNPEKMRYEPAAVSSIECRLPIQWFLKIEDGSPLRNCILEDFNGDHKTDAAWSTSPQDFNVWLYRDGGFASAPDFTYAFPERIEGIIERGDIAGSSRMSLVMRGAKNLYWLCPVQTSEKPE